MAIEHGRIADYPAGRTRRLLLAFVVLCMLFSAAVGCGAGVGLVGWFVPAPRGAPAVALVFGALVAVVAIGWLCLRWIDRREGEFLRYRKGEAGETATAEALRKLPETFHVIHGLDTAQGDIDHLVIGPTGVFALDSKRWTGHYSVDPRGSIVRNGAVLMDRSAAKLQARMMKLRSRILPSGGPDPFFQAALVFTESNLDGSARSIGHVDLVNLDALPGYLTRTRGRVGLTAQEIELLVTCALDRDE